MDNIIPGRMDLKLYRNRDFAMIINFSYTVATMTFAASINTSPITEFTIVKLDNFNIRLSLTSTQINSMAGTTYKWDMKQTDNTGFKQQLIEGNVVIEATITS